MDGLKMFWRSLFLSLELVRIASSHIKECPGVMDLVFMVDVSGSIPVQDIIDVKEMMRKVTSRFIVSPIGTHVALMSFADSTNYFQFFNNTQDITAVHDAIGRLTHPGGGTNMAVAFNDARNMFSLAEGGRRHVTRVLVVVSDGDFQKRELAVESSQPLKDDGIVIIALGISSSVNTKQLQMIASDKGQVLILPDGYTPGRVELISDEITTMICEVARKPEAIVPRVEEKTALQGHLIMSTQAESELLCAFQCLNTVNCFSFNYKTNTQLCELNHANKLTSSNDLLWDFDSVYYEMVYT